MRPIKDMGSDKLIKMLAVPWFKALAIATVRLDVGVKPHEKLSSCGKCKRLGAGDTCPHCGQPSTKVTDDEALALIIGAGPMVVS